MHCSYSEGQSLTWHDSLVIFSPQASSLAGVLSSDRIHLAERVRTPASENANQYRQVTPPARVGYEMVDNRKGKHLLVGFTIFYIDPLQRVDRSCSIHFVEHTSPMFKKRHNLNLRRLYPVKGSDQILWQYFNLEKGSFKCSL